MHLNLSQDLNGKHLNEVNDIKNTHIVFRYKTGYVFLPKQSPKSRSILKDGSRSLGLYRKGKIRFNAKFHKTDLAICSHSRERKTPSYSRINMIINSETACLQ